MRHWNRLCVRVRLVQRLVVIFLLLLHFREKKKCDRNSFFWRSHRELTARHILIGQNLSSLIKMALCIFKLAKPEQNYFYLVVKHLASVFSSLIRINRIMCTDPNCIHCCSILFAFHKHVSTWKFSVLFIYILFFFWIVLQQEHCEYNV